LVPAVAGVLNLDPAEILSGGGYDARPTEPVEPLLQVLPFGDLSDVAFEQFCRSLFAREHPGVEVHRNGSSGDKQNGVDIYIEEPGGRVGVQCKRKKTFGPSAVRAAVEALAPAAGVSSVIIALSRPVAAPAARLEVRSHDGWSLLDGEDLSERVRKLGVDDRLAVVRQYFPNHVAAFLGIAAPSPWLREDEYWVALPGPAGYEQDFELVGRDKELDELRGLLAGDHRLLLVSGRSGSGKTRLLVELARREEARSIRFVHRAPVPASAFELLPTGAPILVVDDAADSETNLSYLVAGIFAERPEATVVLLVQPAREQALLIALGPSILLPTTPRVEVGDLDTKSAKRLARVALGSSATDEAAEALATLGYDCPLLIVIGAHLVQSGAIRASELAASTELQGVIQAKFVASSLVGTDADSLLRILRALAAIQPARLDHQDFLEALCAIAETSKRDAIAAIDKLEIIGLVMRREHSCRVVPDLLGDALLDEAVRSRSGLDTGLASDLASACAGQVLRNALINVSLVDWRQRRRDGGESVAGSLWEAVQELALASPISVRIELVRSVADVAWTQPDAALRLANAILDAPAPVEPDPVGQFLDGSRFLSQDNVAQALTRLVHNAGLNPAYLTRAMQLLWRVGQGDARPENQNPDHGLRLLRELGAYDIGKPVSFTVAFVSEIEAWLDAESDPPRRARILGLLEPALALEGTNTSSDGHSLTLRQFTVPVEHVAGVRSSVVDLAAAELSTSLVSAHAAVALLQEALRGHDNVGSPEFVQVVGVLQRTLADPKADATLRLKAFRALGWHAKYGDVEVKAAVRSARRSLVVDRDLELARTLRGDWHAIEDADDDESDFAGANQRERLRLEALAEDIAGLPTDESILDFLLSRVAVEREVAGDFQPPTLLLDLIIRLRPAFAHYFLSSVLPDRLDEVVLMLAPPSLAAILRTNDSEATVITAQWICAGPQAARTVASALASDGEALESGFRVGVVDLLLGLGDEAIDVALVLAVYRFADRNRDLLGVVATRVAIAKSRWVGRELAMVLSHQGGVAWKALAEGQKVAILESYVACPDLDSYHVGALLSVRAAEDPGSALGVLRMRVERAETEGRDYAPLPFEWHIPLGFRASDAFPSLVRDLVGWVQAGTSWQRRFWGPRLFAQVVGPYDHEVQSALVEALEVGTEAAISAVVSLIAMAPTAFILENPEFVARALKSGASVGTEALAAVQSALYGSTMSGVRSRQIGDPSVRDREQIAGAREIAGGLPSGSLERAFYEGIVVATERSIDGDLARDREFTERRNW
jgi:hypothetical protein